MEHLRGIVNLRLSNMHIFRYWHGYRPVTRAVFASYFLSCPFYYDLGLNGATFEGVVVSRLLVAVQGRSG